MTQHAVDFTQWPDCFKCGMVVQSFGIIDTGKSLIFVARCHGDEQSIEIPDSFWNQQLDETVSLGPAFTDENQ